jgi:hypothetical protein
MEKENGEGEGEEGEGEEEVRRGDLPRIRKINIRLKTQRG